MWLIQYCNPAAPCSRCHKCTFAEWGESGCLFGAKGGFACKALTYSVPVLSLGSDRALTSRPESVPLPIPRMADAINEKLLSRAKWPQLPSHYEAPFGNLPWLALRGFLSPLLPQDANSCFMRPACLAGQKDGVVLGDRLPACHSSIHHRLLI